MKPKADLLLFVPLLAAAAAFYPLAPANPFAHLDDPFLSGAAAYLVSLALLIVLRLSGFHGGRFERFWLLFMFVGFPIPYLSGLSEAGLADGGWLRIELAGGLFVWTMAVLTLVRSPWFLVVGLVGHALWDLGHQGRAPFVPEWYVLGCVVVDLALAVFVAGRIKLWHRGLDKDRDQKAQELRVGDEPGETLNLPGIGEVERLDKGWTREIELDDGNGGVDYVQVHMDVPMGITTRPRELPSERQQGLLRKLPALYPELLPASLEAIASYFEEVAAGRGLETLDRVPLSVEISAADRAQERDLTLSFASEVDDMGYSVVFKDGQVLFVEAGD